MREILFRGAQKVDGCKSLYWYEGSLVSEKDGYTGEVEYYIQNESGSFLVIPKTVGQYTSLTDKNGKKIFEGDIVQGAWETIFAVYYDSDYLQFRAKVKDNYTREIDYYGSSNYIEIIGNIHENPKLLSFSEIPNS